MREREIFEAKHFRTPECNPNCKPRNRLNFEYEATPFCPRHTPVHEYKNFIPPIQNCIQFLEKLTKTFSQYSPQYEIQFMGQHLCIYRYDTTDSNIPIAIKISLEAQNNTPFITQFPDGIGIRMTLMLPSNLNKKQVDNAFNILIKLISKSFSKTTFSFQPARYAFYLDSNKLLIFLDPRLIAIFVSLNTNKLTFDNKNEADSLSALREFQEALTPLASDVSTAKRTDINEKLSPVASPLSSLSLWSSAAAYTVSATGFFGNYAVASQIISWKIFATICAALPLWGWAILLTVSALWFGRNVYLKCKEMSQEENDSPLALSPSNLNRP